jgi:hypothetical protein
MTISAVPLMGLVGQVLKDCWRVSARVACALSFQSRRHGSRGTGNWHTLLEFCGLVGMLIIDEDGLYDPRHTGRGNS